MELLSFYPGPSKLFPFLKEASYEAFNSGILEQNHRSLPFMDLMEETLILLRNRLNIPSNYSIYFVSSATECWEIIGQTLIKESLVFFSNGAFGDKWFSNHEKLLEYSGNRTPIRKIKFGLNDALNSEDLEITEKYIALVPNETSNGTSISKETISQLITENPNSGLIGDFTSSMGAQMIDFDNFDAVFASVQKGFGLPSGMAILAVSNEFISKNSAENYHYNSIPFLEKNYLKRQTSYTPNILDIYLLREVMRRSKNIVEIQEIIDQRAKKIYQFFEPLEEYKLLVEGESVRSNTIIAVSVKNPEKVIEKAINVGILLGKGYGEYKENTFRIANFPAHTDSDFDQLFNFLANESKF